MMAWSLPAEKEKIFLMDMYVQTVQASGSGSPVFVLLDRQQSSAETFRWRLIRALLLG